MAELAEERGQATLDDRRAVTPAVAKSLEMGLVVLFVGLLTTVSLAGIVPDYQRTADAEVGDRVLAAANGEIAKAVPPATHSVTTRHRVDLPATIGGEGYALHIDDRDLVLGHPDKSVSGRLRLVLPDRVDRVEGRWDSGADTVVIVSGDVDGLVVLLAEGGGG
jgi:hypothetical protein